MSSLFRYKLAQGETEQIAKIYQSGISIMTINRVYGFSFRSRVVENALHRTGIEVREGRRKIPLSRENEIVKEYQAGIDSYKLAKKYKITFGAVCELLKRNNCDRRDNRVLTRDIELEVIREYLSGQSVFAVGRKFGIHATTVPLILNRHGYSTRSAGYNSRQYQLNENAFNDLGNEQPAYWLGFIYADGGINKETLSIGLAIKDLSHLEKFRAFLEYEMPIELYKAKTPKGNFNDYCRLSVHSKIITQRLRDLGILKKRPDFSLILSELPKRSYRYFIRGNVDGDGSLEITKRGNTRLRFLGQPDMLNWISEVLYQELDLPKRNIYARTGIYAMEYSGTIMAQKAIIWLYQDAQIFLDRKIGSMTWWKEKGGS